MGARGSVVGWGTMLQAGRSRVRILMRWIFSNLPNPSSRTMVLRSTQLLTEMSTRNLLGVKSGRRVWLTSLPSVSRLSIKCRILNIWKPYGPLRPVTGIPLLLLYLEMKYYCYRKIFYIYEIAIVVSIYIDNVLLKMVAPTETCKGWKIKRAQHLSITLDGVNNPLYYC
jgi:hypothetical protein